MVAVVSGNGLGLFNASLNILGNGVNGRDGSLGQAGGRSYVNVANGNLVLQFQDEFLSGRGLDLNHLRTYNSQGLLNDGDLDGWRWDGERKMTLTGTANAVGSKLTRIGGDGSSTEYLWTVSSSRYESTDGNGAHDFVVGAGTGTAAEWVWTEGSTRVIERYNKTGGLLKSIEDQSGDKVVFTYTSGRLTSVKDSASGQELVLVYNTSNKLVRVDSRSVASGVLTRQVYYTYDTTGRLTSVKSDLSPLLTTSATAAAATVLDGISDNNVYTTTYTYDGTSTRVASISQSDGTSVAYTYEQVGTSTTYRIKTVTDQFGVQTFVYTTGRTDLIDGAGQTWSYYYDAKGQLTQVQSPALNNGTISTHIFYDAQGNVSQVMDGQGHSLTYQYDAQGNRTLERDALGNTVTRTYNSNNQLVTETRYREVDPDGAGSGLPTGTETSRFVYDSKNRLRFSVSAEGRVTESRYDSFGLLSHQIQYASGTYAVAALTPTSVLTETQLTTWVSSQDKTKTLLSTFTYDTRGNLNKRTDFTEVNTSGVGVLTTAATVTDYVYSDHGQLLQTIAVRGTTSFTLSSTVYDGAGRQQSVVNAEGTSTYTYDGTNRRINVVNSAGLTVTQAFDARGRLISVTQTAAAETSRSQKYIYDAAGQLRMIEDALGQRSYTFYDAAGRISHQVDKVGAVTKFDYDKNGRVLKETRYATPVTTTGWYDTTTATVSKTSLVENTDIVLNAALDRSTRYEYDAAGRLTTQIDAANAVRFTRYDGTHRVTQSEQGDRITRYYYDQDGRQVGTIDPAGYLTENIFDAAGRLVQTIRYATAINLPPTWVTLANQTTAVNNANFSYTLPLATDPNGGPITYSVVGSLPPGLSLIDNTATGGTLVLSGTPTTPNTYTVTLKASDNGGGEVTQSFTLTVSNAGPVWPTFEPLNHLGGSFFSYTIPAATDPENQALSYSVVGSLPAGLSFDPVTRILSGTPSNGIYGITLRATDPHGLASNVVFTLVVANDAPVYNNNLTPQSSRQNLPASAYQIPANTFTDPEGMTLSYKATGMPAGLVFNASNRTFSGTPTAAVGTYTVTVTASDGVYSSSANFVWTITPTNTAPLYSGGLQDISMEVVIEPSSTISFQFALPLFTDPDGDAITYTATFPSGLQLDYSVNSSFISFFNYISIGSNPPIIFPLQYGTWLINVTATDSHGGSTSQTFSLTIMAPGSGLSSSRLNNTTTSAPSTANNLNGVPATTRVSEPLSVVSANNALPATAVSLASLRPAASALDQKSYFYYDGQGRQIASVDAQGYLTRITYDAAANLQQTTRYLTPVTAGFNDLTLLTTNAGTGQTSTVNYDNYGRIAKQVAVDGTTTTYEYDTAGRLVRQVVSDAISNNTQTNIEARGSRIQYNAFGEVTGRVSGVGEATLAVNPLDAAIQTAINSYGTRYQYDALGRLIKTTDANGNSSYHYYDAQNRLSHTVNALGVVQENQYNVYGQIDSTTTYHTLLNTAGLTGGVATAAFKNSLTTSALDRTTRYTYDLRGQLKTQTDAEGFVTTNTYTQYGELETQTRTIAASVTVTDRYFYSNRGQQIGALRDLNGLNISNTVEYDAFGRIIKSIDAAGKITTTDYSSRDSAGNIINNSGRTVTITDPLGRTQRSDYDAFGRVLDTYDGFNQKTSYTYDDLNRSLTVTTPEQISVTTRKNRHGETLSVTDGQGHTTSYSYTKDGQLDKVTDAKTVIIRDHDYDASGRLIVTTDALGRRTKLDYDAINRILTRTVDEGVGKLNLKTTYTYNTSGQQLSVTEGAGTPEARTTEYQYDKKGQLKTVITDPAGLKLTTTYHYDGVGNTLKIEQGDASNLAQRVTEYQFDKLNRRTEERVDPTGLNLRTQYKYNAQGRVTRKIDANGNSTWYIYDVASQLRYNINALGEISRRDYNLNGQQISSRNLANRLDVATLAGLGDNVSLNAIQAPITALQNDAQDQRTVYIYDQIGRQTHTLQALQTLQGEEWMIRENNHDKNNNVIETRRYDKLLTAASFTSLSTILNTANGQGSEITKAEMQAALTALGYSDTALGNTQQTRYVYDANNRLRFTIDAEGAVRESTFDDAGQLTSNTQFNSKPVIPAILNESNLNTELNRSDANNRTTRYAYDGASRLRFTIDAMGAVSESTYDAVGNITSSTQFNSIPVLSTYDEAAINTALNRSDVNNRTTRYAYDDASRLRFTIDAMGAISESTYDAMGNITSSIQYLHRPTLTAYTEGDIRSVINTTVVDVGSGVTMANDALNRKTKFHYDLAGRLDKTTDALDRFELYKYDAVGNRIALINKKGDEWNYVYDKANRLVDEITPSILVQLSGETSASERRLVTRISYDALGNVLSRSEGILRSITDGSENTTDARTTEYGYDQLGRQVRTIAPGYYDPNSGSFEKTMAAGRFQRTVEVSYDVFGNAVRNQIRVGADNSPSSFVTQYKTYDRLGRVLQEVDALKQVTAYTYDNLGQLEKVTRHSITLTTAPANTSHWTAAELHSAVVTDTEARTVTTTYDKRGRKIKVTLPTVANNFYSSRDTSVTNAPTIIAESGTPTTTYEYNSFGEVVRESVLIQGNDSSALNSGHWRNSYHYYDNNGRRELSVDALGYGTRSEYDAIGNVIATTEYASIASNLAEISTSVKPQYTDATQNRRTEFVYNALNQKTQTKRTSLYFHQRNPSTNQWEAGYRDTVVATLEYDVLGNVVKQTDALGNLTRIDYNKLGQVSKTTLPTRLMAGTGVNPTLNTLSSSPTITLTLNAFGEVVNELHENGGGSGETIRVRHHYDHLGNERQTERGFISDFSVNSQTSIHNEYDVAGRVRREYQYASASFSNWSAGNYDHLIDKRYVYDRSGRQVSTLMVVEHPKIAGQFDKTSGKVSGQYSAYNAFGEVFEEGQVSGTLVQGEALLSTRAIMANYTYDKAGRVLTRQAADGLTAYYYNLVGNTTRQEQRGNGVDTDGTTTRLTETAYDALGRATLQRLPSFMGYATDATVTGATTSMLHPKIQQDYDRWGNVIKQTDAAGAITVYTYDHDNRVIKEERPTVSATDENGVTFNVNVNHKIGYDVLGRAVFESDLADDPTTSTVVEERHLRTRYKEYNSVGQLTADIDATGIRTDYLYDAHGNRVATKNALGNIFTDRFDANGNVVESRVLRILHMRTYWVPPEPPEEPGHPGTPGYWTTAVTYLPYASGQTLLNYAHNTSTHTEGVAQTLIHQVLSQFQYDGAGRQHSRLDMIGGTQIGGTQIARSNYQYDERGNITATRNPSGIVKTMRYDAFGFKIEEKDALQNRQYWNYRHNVGNISSYTFGQLSENGEEGVVLPYASTRATVYTYNDFGQIAQTQDKLGTHTAQPKIYSYHGNGALKAMQISMEVGVPGGTTEAEIDYRVNNSTTLYDYDIKGQRVRESYATTVKTDVGDYQWQWVWDEVTNQREYRYVFQDYVRVISNSTTHQTLSHYDALGRLIKVSGTASDLSDATTTRTTELQAINYRYDELGNRRNIITSYKTASNTAFRGHNHWYMYDAEGRITLAKGVQANSQIVTGVNEGTIILYDQLGRRSVAQTNGDIKSYGPPGEPVEYYADYKQEQYTYDEFNRLTGIDQRAFTVFYGHHNPLGVSSYEDSTAAWNNTERREYDLRGNQTALYHYHQNGNEKDRTQTTYYDDSRIKRQDYFTNGALSTTAKYDGTDSYDAAGNLKSYTFFVNNNRSYTNTYIYSYTSTFGGYKEQQIRVSSSKGGPDGLTTNTYNVQGQLANVYISGGSSTSRSFIYDHQGRILTKIEGVKKQDYFYVNGNPVANIGEITDAEFDFNYTPISSQYPGSSPGAYVVNSGDTLGSIAQAVFGDAALWYLIADANNINLGHNDALTDHIGKNFTIPNVVGNIHNNSETFKPYNPAEIIGDTTPVPAPPPPPKVKNKCAALSAIIQIVVNIVVTYYTGNPAAGAAAGDAAGQTSTAIFNGRYDWKRFARYTLNPFKGNSDDHRNLLFNPMAAGMPDEYDYKRTARAAATAYVGTEVGNWVGQSLQWSQAATTAAQAASTALTSYGMNKLMGVEDHLSMRSLLATTAGAYLGDKVLGLGSNIPSTSVDAAAFSWGNFAAEMMKAYTRSALNYNLQKAFGADAQWNSDSRNAAAIDAFGNALGTSLVSAREFAKQNRAREARMAQMQQEQMQARINGQLAPVLEQSRLPEPQIGEISTPDLISKIIARGESLRERADQVNSYSEQRYADVMQASQARQAGVEQSNANYERNMQGHYQQGLATGRSGTLAAGSGVDLAASLRGAVENAGYMPTRHNWSLVAETALGTGVHTLTKAFYDISHEPLNTLSNLAKGVVDLSGRFMRQVSHNITGGYLGDTSFTDPMSQWGQSVKQAYLKGDSVALGQTLSVIPETVWTLGAAKVGTLGGADMLRGAGQQSLNGLQTLGTNVLNDLTVGPPLRLAQAGAVGDVGRLRGAGKAVLAGRYGTTAERTQLLENVITMDGGLNTSQTVARQLAGPRNYIPNQSVLDTVGSGTRVADSQGVAGQFMYRAPAQFNNSSGTLEVLVHEPSGQVRHVLFRSGQ